MLGWLLNQLIKIQGCDFVTLKDFWEVEKMGKFDASDMQHDFVYILQHEFYHRYGIRLGNSRRFTIFCAFWHFYQRPT